MIRLAMRLALLLAASALTAGAALLGTALAQPGARERAVPFKGASAAMAALYS